VFDGDGFRSTIVGVGGASARSSSAASPRRFLKSYKPRQDFVVLGDTGKMAPLASPARQLKGPSAAVAAARPSRVPLSEGEPVPTTTVAREAAAAMFADPSASAAALAAPFAGLTCDDVDSRSVARSVKKVAPPVPEQLLLGERRGTWERGEGG
jgi:hypothetical protein